MCKKAINIITPALDNITQADALLRIKNVLALFIQTMDVSKTPPYAYGGQSGINLPTRVGITP